MRYVFVGSFSMDGGGYTSLLKNISQEMVKRDHEVMIVATDYDKQPHNFPFKIVPIEYAWTYQAILQLPDVWQADRVIVTMDIPKLHQLSQQFIKQNEKQRLWLLEALYPVESEPIRKDWTESLGQYRQRLVISQWGTEICREMGLDTVYLPMGCRAGKRPEGGDKQAPRNLLEWPVDHTTFLTIAANHERKGLPLAIEAFSQLPEDTHYVIVTDLRSKIGWRLNEIADRFGVRERMTIVEFGISSGLLSTMYWAADALVVPSQAEGACLPVYEAVAHGLPVIGGDWTALDDVAEENWYMPIGYDYKYIFPWGSANRWMASVDDMVYHMGKVHSSKERMSRMSKSALSYANGRKWSLAADVLEESHVSVSNQEKKTEIKAVVS